MSNNNQSETESTEEQPRDAEESTITVPGSMSYHKDGFEIPRCGQLVRDPEGDGGEGVALFVRDQTAEDVAVAAVGKTVAELNPHHPAEAPVVGVAFKGQLRDKFADRWERMRTAEPEYLVFRAGNSGVGVYDFPVTRLEWGRDAGVWRCMECETEIIELELSGDQREAGGPCPECGEMRLSATLPEEVAE